MTSWRSLVEPAVKIHGSTEAATPLPPPRPGADSEYFITVSIASLHVSNDPSATLVTYALGSCIGVAVHDPVLCVGALMHVMLPTCQAGFDAAWARPAMFMDTAVPLLLGAMLQLGCAPSNIVVKVAGGGQLLSASQALAIGTRNIAAVRVACAAHDLSISGEDVGGTRSRNLSLQVGSGRIVVSSCGEERVL
jgi:chemotaxis protein CheD